MNILWFFAVMGMLVAFLMAAYHVLSYLAIAVMLFAALCLVGVTFIPRMKRPKHDHDKRSPDDRPREISLSRIFARFRN